MGQISLCAHSSPRTVDLQCAYEGSLCQQRRKPRRVTGFFLGVMTFPLMPTGPDD